jgi:hypothetical protein
MTGEIIQGEADEGLAAGQYLPGITATLRGAFQPAHAAVLARGKPGTKGMRVAGFMDAGNPASIESQLARPRFDLCMQQVHGWLLKK